MFPFPPYSIMGVECGEKGSASALFPAIRKFGVLLLCLLLYQSSFAVLFFQDGRIPSIDKIDRDTGLSNLSVSSIVEDRDGFLWFGTQGGLNYYDGKKFTAIRNNPFVQNGLVHNLIQTMYYNQENHELWIGTYQGISRYDINQETFVNYEPGETGLTHPVIVAITKDSQGQFWAGTLNGLNRIDPETHEIQQYPVPGNVVRSLHEDSLGRLWIGTYEGLCYFNISTDSVEKYEKALPSSNVMVIREYTPQKLHLGLWGGSVAILDLETGFLEEIPLPDNRIYTLTMTDDGTLWAGSWGGGLFALPVNGDLVHFSPGNKEAGISHPVAYSLLQDSSGILWLGTNGGGINKINPRKINYVKFRHDPDNPDSLRYGKINSIYRDNTGILWVAIYNEGVQRWDSEKEVFISYRKGAGGKHSLDTNAVTTIAESEGQLLLGTDKGIYRYDRQKDTFSAWNILPEQENVYGLTSRPGELWIGTYSSGVYRYSYTEGTLESFRDGAGGTGGRISDNLIYQIITDGTDSVWVATNNGLNRIDTQTGKVEIFYKEPGNRSALASNNIRTLLKDSSGQIWIGSVGGGLAKYLGDGKFTTYTEAEGLSSNVVSSILEGDDGRIWVSTHEGISVFYPETETLETLTPSDGIGGWEFNAGAFKDTDGTLFFGGIHGVTGISDTFLSASAPPAKMFIYGLEVFQKPLSEKRTLYNEQEVRLPFDQNFVGFHFVALDYDAPEKIRYYYRLEGFDADWVSADTRDYASYSNLPPGKYVFSVYGETIRGNQSETAFMTLVIQSPWYQTPVAYLAFIALFLILLWGIIKLYEGRRLQEKNKELSGLNEKLESLNQELESLSVKDTLTGLYNRRYLGQQLEEYIHLARRSQCPISLAMVDIDNFKKFNDEYGHIAGDYLLADLALAISHAMPRNTDFAARFGGDEFLVVLYDTNQEGALRVLEKIREQVRGLHVREEFGTAADYLSISAGLLTLIPESTHTAESLINQADMRLYQAKQQGKNRIIFG